MPCAETVAGTSGGSGECRAGPVVAQCTVDSVLRGVGGEESAGVGEMILHWPQITVLVMTVLSLGIMLEKNGKPKIGNENFVISLVSSMIVLWLLWEGGFFSQVCT
jgi:hypothetical protein